MSVAVNPRPIAVAKSLLGEHLREYDRMMRERPDLSRTKCSGTCKDCPYYHPDWEHRFCLYTSCKYGRNINVFDVKHKAGR